MNTDKQPITVKCKCGFENTLRRLCQKCGKELEKVAVTEADLNIIYDRLSSMKTLLDMDAQERYLSLQEHLKRISEENELLRSIRNKTTEMNQIDG